MNTTEGEGAKNIAWDETINGESRSKQVGIQNVSAASSLQVSQITTQMTGLPD